MKIFQTVYNNDGTVDEHIQRTPKQAKDVCKKYKVENPDGKEVGFYDIWEVHIDNVWQDRASNSPWDNGQHVFNLATNQTIDPLWKLLASYTGPKGKEIPLIFTDKFVYINGDQETKVNWQHKRKMSELDNMKLRSYWANDAEVRQDTPVSSTRWTREFLPAAVQACKKYWPGEQLIWDQDNPIYNKSNYTSQAKKNEACKAFKSVLNQCKGMKEMIFNARMGQGILPQVCIHFPREYNFMVEMLTDSKLMPEEPFSVDAWEKKRREEAQARAVQVLTEERARAEAERARAAEVVLSLSQNSDGNGAENCAENCAANCAENCAATHEPNTPSPQEAVKPPLKEMLVHLLKETGQPMTDNELVDVIRAKHRIQANPAERKDGTREREPKGAIKLFVPNHLFLLYYKMKTKDEPRAKLKLLKSSAFTIDTPEHLPKMHFNMLLCGRRGQGKSLAATNMLRMLMEGKALQRAIVISPTFNGNKLLMKDLNIKETDVFDDPDDPNLPQRIMDIVDEERDEFLRYQHLVKEYENVMKMIKTGGLHQIESGAIDEYLLAYFNPITNEFNLPKPANRGKLCV